MDVADRTIAGVETVIREFTDHRFDRTVPAETGEGPMLAAADEAFFAAVVRGVVSDQAALDQAIARRLAKTWRLDRLDATARAILRCGAYRTAAVCPASCPPVAVFTCAKAEAGHYVLRAEAGRYTDVKTAVVDTLSEGR